MKNTFDRKITILHIIKSLGRGGAEKLLAETIRHHNTKVFEFHYIFFLPWKNQMVNDITENGGKVTCIPARNNFGIIKQLPAIKRYIRQNNVRLVHCHLPWAGITGRIAAKWAGVPVVYTEHNNISRYHPFTRFFSKLTMFLSDIVIPVSSDAQKALKHIMSPTKIKLVENGVDTVKFSRSITESSVRAEFDLKENEKVIMAAAVFRVQKRLDLWLKVAKQVLESNRDCKFILIGDGPEKETLLRLSVELNFGDRLIFAGSKENVGRYLNIADVYLMTSDFEGLPVALLEAMSMGCAPIATRVGGIPEVIENGTSGYLCDAGDVNALASKVIDLLNDDKMLSIIKTNARKRIETKFSMEKMVKKIESIYDNIISE